MKGREYLTKAILRFFPELELKQPRIKFKIRDKIIYDTRGGIFHGFIQDIHQDKYDGRWFYHTECWHPDNPKELRHYEVSAGYLEGDLGVILRK